MRDKCQEKKSERKGKHFFRKEIVSLEFERAMMLPVAVNEDGAKSSSDSAVLKIVMPKEKRWKSHKAKIKA